MPSQAKVLEVRPNFAALINSHIACADSEVCRLSRNLSTVSLLTHSHTLVLTVSYVA
jgi:hypothetical protein